MKSFEDLTEMTARSNRFSAATSLLGSIDAISMLLQEPDHHDPASAWTEHIPFAFWLIDAHRPRHLVELGTSGASYFAFCQAVALLGLATRCHAVDTWRGGEVSALHDDRVFASISDYNAKNYGSFSELLRCTSDEALPYFLDASIDLLHIDRLHTYEAVKGDFESWLPKLSNRALVLFHDTNVRERDFGVFRYWDEIKSQYPHFEFVHGHGLGLLGVGKDIGRQLSALFDASRDHTGTGAVRDGVRRAARVLKTRQLLRASEEQVARLAAEYTARQSEIQWLAGELVNRDIEIARLGALVTEAVERANQEAHRGDEAERSLQQMKRRADQAVRSVQKMKRRAVDAEDRLTSIETSSSWRASEPFRKFGLRFPYLAKSVRLGAELGWWTITLQLPSRYRLWRDYHERQAASRQSLIDQTRPRLINPVEIRIPSSNEPLVSVIICTYGQVDATLSCLKSIADNTPRCPIEVLVVDDAYVGQEKVSVLAEVSGIQFSKNNLNLGFLRSCNLAARRAKGRYIYLLNNDTEIQTESIDALVDLLETRTDVGMVGSKLLFPDGRLQEAGGIIWADASGWNYGRGEDPSRPEYNYMREVDYCSGASLMIRRTLFEMLGGFDEAFVPAYYEDTDLAFRMRECGYKVVFEPRSVIIHHEGMSHGTDLTMGIKAHQVINQGIMRKRWNVTLAQKHFPNGTHPLQARDRAQMRKVILVIDHQAPEPDRDAGSRSTVGVLDSLVNAGWVVKFWPYNRAYSSVYTIALEKRGIEVLDKRWPGSLRVWMDENGCQLDHLLVMRPSIAEDVLPYLAQKTDAVLSFYGFDLHFARLRSQAGLDDNLDLLEKAHAMERRVWRHFDVVIYPSEAEAAIVRTMAPQTHVRSIIPFCFDPFPERTLPIPERNILFVAGFADPPNVDAAAFLVHELIPPLEAELGPIKVALVGPNPTDAVKSLAGPNVVVTGYVNDTALSELYDSHRVAIVPLRFGAGVKGTVVEAFSRGLPLVTTSVGAQGIVGFNELVPVHDDVPDIVAALKALLTNDAAWLVQSKAQMAFAQRFYSAQAMQQSVLSALDAGESAAGKTSIATVHAPT